MCFSCFDCTEAAFIDSNGYWGIVENIPTQTSLNKQSTEKGKHSVQDQKLQPSSRVESERELNEDELAAALFEGK